MYVQVSEYGHYEVVEDASGAVDVARGLAGQRATWAAALDVQALEDLGSIR
jgi:hypothetical protein